LGDLDGDGHLDLVCVPSVFLNDGTGVFAKQPGAPFASYVYDIKLADLDGDGDLDAVIASDGSSLTDHIASGIFINDGAGPFSAGQSSANTVTLAHRVAVGDLDNDGDLDLVFSAWDGTPNAPGTQSQWVFFNDGTGKFSPSSQDFGAIPSMGVDVGDIDG